MSITDVTSFIQNLLIFVGQYSPLIAIVISLFALHDVFLCLLIIADFVLINPTLKRIIGLLGLQSKRPSAVALDGYKTYGMPSGHVEIQWIVLTYLLYQWIKQDRSNYVRRGTLTATGWIIAMALMTGITMWQRWIQEHIHW